MEYTYDGKKPRIRPSLRPDTVLVGVIIFMALLVILFPMLAKARDQVTLNSCASNLKSIGQSIRLYMADNDERFPAAVDPSDKFVSQLWAQQPARYRLVKKLPLLQVPLKPYLSRPDVFHCPADTGGKVMDNSYMGEPTLLPAYPSYYAAFGTSYLFRTEIMFRSLEHKGFWPKDSVAMLFDGCGQWHGQGPALEMGLSFDRFNQLIRYYKYNTLYADLHVKPLWFSELYETWQVPL